MKKIIYGVAGFITLLIFILIFGLLSLESFITPEFVVKQIEANTNARAHVEKINISLFSALSSVNVEGVKLAPRDKFADMATPLGERDELKSSVLSLDSVDLGISFGAILKKEFRLDKLLLNSPNVSLVLFENGTNNLSSLFQPPVTVAGEPNPKLTPEALAERKKEEEEAKKSEEPKEAFNIKEIPISISMGELGIKNGNIEITMKKTGQVIKLLSTDLVLKDLDIVPSDLANHNSLDLKLDTNLSVIGKNGQESALFILRSSGTIQPFDANSGEPNPGIVHTVTIKEDSYMNGFAAFDALAGGLPALNALNIKADKIAQKAELTDDVTTKLGYSKGRVTFKDSPTFPSKNYDLKINEGTWIQITNSTHEMNARVLATKEESDKALSGLDKSLEGAKGVDTSSIKKEILGDLVENGRLALPFRSSGPISNPRVTLGVDLPSMTGLLKSQATKAVKDAFNKAVPKEAKDVLNKFKF